MLEASVIALSILLQFAATYLALRLIPVTKGLTAWIFIAAGLFFMGVRRCFTLFYLIWGSLDHPPDLSFEVVGLVTSLLMAIGIYWIAPLFISIRESAEALRKSEAKSRALVDAIPDLMFRMKEDGTFLDFRAAGTCSPILTDTDVIGKNVRDTMPGDIAAQIMQYTAEALNKGDVRIFEYQFFQNGKPCSYEARIVVIGEDEILAIVRDITERRWVEEEREKLIAKLREALANIKTLTGLLPICAVCKKIRDDKGYWSQVDEYIREHTDAEFSHGICPDCAKKVYPEYYSEEKTRQGREK